MDHEKPRQHHPRWAVSRSLCREAETHPRDRRSLGRQGGTSRQMLRVQRITSADDPRRAIEAASAAGDGPRPGGRRSGSTADDLRHTVTVAEPAARVRVRYAPKARFDAMENRAGRQGPVIRAPCSRHPRGWHEDGPGAPLDGARLFGVTVADEERTLR